MSTHVCPLFDWFSLSNKIKSGLNRRRTLISSMNIPIDNDLFQKLKGNKIEQWKKTSTTKFKYSHHKTYRFLIKKLRRQISRQKSAREREEQQQNDPLYQAWLLEKENRRKQQELDEERELEKGRKLREQRELLRKRLEEEKQNVSQLELSKQVNERPTHNPFPPGPIIERPICIFYARTGVCRYNQRCHRTHQKPDITNTLLAVNMYSNFQMQYGLDEEYDLDIGLEFEESERYENFKDFYYDILPEFERFGRVMTLKVCSNAQVHLRGNVYVQYETDYQAMLVYQALNTRYYAGRMVQCEFINIPSWSAAICGLSLKGKCPKGRHCNYLHVFHNPSSSSSRSHKRQKTSR